MLEELRYRAIAVRCKAPRQSPPAVEEEFAPNVVIDRDLDNTVAIVAIATTTSPEVLRQSHPPLRSRPPFEPVSCQSPGV